MQKRAQITVFIIIGITIIAIFGLIFFITSEVSKTQLEIQANRIVDSVLATVPLNYYVTTCVEESTKEGLRLIGDQGGYIVPPTTTGTTLNFQDPVDSTKSYTIAYAIQRDVSKPPFTPNNPCSSQYPCSSCGNSPAYCGFINNITQYSDLPNTNFGLVTFPSIESYESALGKPYCPETLFVDFSYGTSRNVDPCAADNQYSIKSELEAYVSNKTLDCVDLASIPAFNQTFNITKGNITTNLTLGDNGIDITVNWPLYIKVQDFEPVVRILKFSTFVPVRLKDVYELARYLVERDNSDLNFNLWLNWTNNTIYAGFGQPPSNPFLLQFWNLSNKDRVVRLYDLDKSHYLRNGPFYLQFAIQERPPALDYIHNVPFEQGGLFDVVVAENDTIVIDPAAGDPDGDNITYTYSGWKETYNETFDYTKCPDSSAADINFQDCITRDNTQHPHVWTTSNLFKKNSRTANYTTTHLDIGPHELTVCANDSIYADCQTVRVLVYDLFKVKATSLGYYDTNEIGPLNSSLEDPLNLRANIVNYFNPGPKDIIWQIVNPSTLAKYTLYENDTYVPNLLQLLIPGDYSFHLDYFDSYYQIASAGADNIFSYFNPIFNGIAVSSGSTFNATVTVVKTTPGGTTRTATDSLQFTLSSCIPHRNDTPIFPYGDSNNPYLENHTCCTDQFTYQPSTVPCYQQSAMGCYDASLNNFYAGVELRYSAFNPPTTQQAFAQSFSTENDVYQLNFSAYCSGSRGNICNGETRAAMANVSSCSDLSPGETERCNGCSETAVSTGANGCGSSSPGSCCSAVPPGKTFESEHGLNDAVGNPATGACNKNPACTNFNNSNHGYVNPGTPFSDGTYEFVCNATCDGSGSCSKTTPQICNECFQEQTCNWGDGVVSGQSGGCDPSSAGCATHFYQYASTCINGDILTNYSCKTVGQGLYTPPPAYSSETAACVNSVTEVPATVTKDITTSISTCTEGVKAECVTVAVTLANKEGISVGNCTPVNLDTITIKDSCTKDTTLSQFNYSVAFANDTNSLYEDANNKIPESCAPNPTPVIYKIEGSSGASGLTSAQCTLCGGTYDSIKGTCS